MQLSIINFSSELKNLKHVMQKLEKTTLVSSRLPNNFFPKLHYYQTFNSSFPYKLVISKYGKGFIHSFLSSFTFPSPWIPYAPKWKLLSYWKCKTKIVFKNIVFTKIFTYFYDLVSRRSSSKHNLQKLSSCHLNYKHFLTANYTCLEEERKLFNFCHCSGQRDIKQ